MAEKRPPTGLKSPFGDAILKKGSPIDYSATKGTGSENRGGKSSGSSK